MHPYLTRLGIRTEVQSFFQPFYSVDEAGNLVFDYNGSIEHYGIAFHRIPVTENYWLVGSDDFDRVRQVFICSSAMDALAWFNLNYTRFANTDNLLFVSLGAAPLPAHLRWLNEHLMGKTFSLLFANDLLGHIADLKTAAGIRRIPVTVTVEEGSVLVRFRLNEYRFPESEFSLSSMEKKAGYRFNIRTLKPKGFISFFDQLKAAAFQTNS